jgi:hypothetical protein
MNHSFSTELLPLLSTAQLGGTHFLSVDYFIVGVVSFLREEDRCPRKKQIINHQWCCGDGMKKSVAMNGRRGGGGGDRR